MKVKLSEVAALAGVGHATVDRVLNERGGVAPSTAKRVIEAARQLGWARDLPSLYRTGVRIEVFLGHKEIPLFAGINRALDRLIPTLGRGVIIQRTFVNDNRPEMLARAIAKTKSNAVIIHGQEEDVVIDAISHITAAGIPVIALISDLPTSPRLAYVGIDHFKAGRCAAFLLSRMTSSDTFFVLCHSSEFRAHSERISGFRAGLKEYCSVAKIVRLIEDCDDEISTVAGLKEAFQQHPDVAAIYNSGASNLVIEKALARIGRNGIAFVGHDFAGDARPMLRAGTMTAAIGERIDRQAKQAIDLLLRRFGFIDQEIENTMTPFNILVRDNIE